MSAWNRRPAGYWDPAPYPGERPDCSWRLAGDHVHRIVPVGQGEWLDTVTEEEIDLGGRVFILAYGSNATPGKLLGMDAVMLRAEITDAQAVWSEGRRRHDDAVVATVAAVRGHVEACPVLAVDPKEVALVDGWEFPAYDRAAFWGRCTLENGVDVAAQIYVGGPKRQPLRHDGRYLPLHEFDHDYVDRIVGW